MKTQTTLKACENTIDPDQTAFLQAVRGWQPDWLFTIFSFYAFTEKNDKKLTGIPVTSLLLISLQNVCTKIKPNDIQ